MHAAGKTSATAAAAAAAAAHRQQEDAQEFLSFLLDSAHQELLALKARVSGALTGDGADGTEGADGAKGDSAEASGDAEEWLTAGRSKRRGKAAVTRGTTNLQVRHCCLPPWSAIQLCQVAACGRLQLMANVSVLLFLCCYIDSTAIVLILHIRQQKH